MLYEPNTAAARTTGELHLDLLRFARGWYSFDSVPVLIGAYREFRSLSHSYDDAFTTLDAFVSLHERESNVGVEGKGCG
jgi:hypothetical protein